MSQLRFSAVEKAFCTKPDASSPMSIIDESRITKNLFSRALRAVDQAAT